MLGAWGEGVGTDAAAVAGKAAGSGLAVLQTSSAIAAAGSAGAGATTVGPLLAAAGVSSSVPVAGWIAAGGLAAAAGTVGLVKAIRAGKMRKREAVAQAKAMGIPDAADVPAFTAKALRLAQKNPSKLVRLGKRLEKKLGRKGFLRGKKKRAHMESRLRIVGAVLALRMAEKRGRAEPAAPLEVMEQAQEVTPFSLALLKSPQVAVPLLVFGVSLGLLVAFRASQRR